MILGRCQRQRGFTIRQRKEGQFFPFHEFLDDHFCPSGSKDAVHHGGIYRIQGFLNGHRDGNALASGQAIGLYNNRGTLGMDIVLGGLCIGKPAIGGGGNIVFCTDILAKPLGSFQRGGGGTGSEDDNIFRAQAICQTIDQGPFGTDYDKIDGLLRNQGFNPIKIIDSDWAALGILGDACIARRTEQGVTQGRCGKRPT